MRRNSARRKGGSLCLLLRSLLVCFAVEKFGESKPQRRRFGVCLSVLWGFGDEFLIRELYSGMAVFHRPRPARGGEDLQPCASRSYPASVEKGRPARDGAHTHARMGGVSCAKVLRWLGADNLEETLEILSLMSLANASTAELSEVNGVARPQCEGCQQPAGRLPSAHCDPSTESFRARLPIPPACTDRGLYEEAHPLPTPPYSPPRPTRKVNRPDGSAIARRRSPLCGVLSSPHTKMLERTVTPQTPPRRQPQSPKSLETASIHKNRESATYIRHSCPIAYPSCQQSSQLDSPGQTFFSTPSSFPPRQPVHRSPLHSPPQTVLTSGPSSGISSQQSPQSLMHEPQCPLVWIKGQRLGQGSFGAVYEGWNLEDGSFFAVKVSKQEDASPEIQQEVAVLRQLSHPNIVQYLGSSVENGCICIFLELVRMGSLECILRKYKCLEEQVIRIYTRQILYGLEYLHQRNTIHRDIKCANILVDVNGQVKLADFGVAKQVDLSLAASCKGTPLYMAPEVMKSGQKSYGLLADIWSLGCTVLEMAEGKPPWSNLKGFSFYFKVSGGELPPIPEHLSAEAKRFILSCLKLKPEDRPTASELLQHPFLANAPTSVPLVPWLPSSITSPFSPLG